MNDAIAQMLKKYTCTTSAEYRNALKEIIQQLALYGLWRGKFFEHAAFYGGTALKIIHGLNRFSEDLDFSLLISDPSYDLSKYENAVQKELEAFGFTMEVEVKKKNMETAVQSAFLKGNTLEHLLLIGMPGKESKYFHPQEKVKIKFEVDTDPPPRFCTEAIPVYSPVMFSVRTYCMTDMFAGKLSALLFRQWQRRVKGRDWYDFLWFISQNIFVNLDHLQARMVQIEKWPSDKKLSLEELQELIHHKIEKLDLELAKEDVLPFIKDQAYVEGWTKDLFHAAVKKLAFR